MLHTETVTRARSAAGQQCATRMPPRSVEPQDLRSLLSRVAKPRPRLQSGLESGTGEYALPLRVTTRDNQADNWPAIDGRLHRRGSNLTPLQQLAQLNNLCLSLDKKSAGEKARTLPPKKMTSMPRAVSTGSMPSHESLSVDRSGHREHTEQTTSRRASTCGRSYYAEQLPVAQSQRRQRSDRGARPARKQRSALPDLHHEHEQLSPTSTPRRKTRHTTKLAEWCHQEREKRAKERSFSNAGTPVAGSPRTRRKSIPLTGDCLPSRHESGHTVPWSCVAFFYTVWSLVTTLMLSMALMSKNTFERQPKTEQSEWNVANEELHTCREEIVRCRLAMIQAEKCLASTQLRLDNIRQPALEGDN